MPSLARLIAAGTAILVCAVAAPVAAADPLPLTVHGAPAVTDIPNDGVIAPGDDLALTVTVHNGGATALTGLQATLSSTNADVTDAVKNYPDLADGADGANTAPFHVTLPAAMACGTTLNFTLSFTSGAGTADVPFTLATGGTGALVPYNGNPTVIGDATPTLRPHLTYSGTAPVTAAGVVKRVEVVIGDLVHPDISKLGLELVAPDATRVMLVDHRGSATGTFSGTELLPDAAMPIALGSSPFTGSFTPDGDLGTLVGRSQLGTWKLAVSEADPTIIGRLNNWTLRIAPADCTPRSAAKLSLSAPRIDPGDSVTLDAGGSVSVNPPISRYEWDLGTHSFADGPSLRTETFAARGQYTIKVRVSDANGVIGTASQTLIVSEVPTASITLPPSPKEGSSAQLQGSGTDPEGTAVTYDWDIDGSHYSEQNPIVYFGSPGPHTVTLRVTDGDGAVGATQATLNVLPTTPPVAAMTATPNPVLAGDPVAFDASDSYDPDGSVVAYEWDLDGNGSFETRGGASVQRTYPNPTVLSVGVRVTDNDGRTAVARVPLTIQMPGGGGDGGSAAGSESAPGGSVTGGAGGVGGGAQGGGSGGGPAGGGGAGSAGGGHATLAASLQGAAIQKLKLVTKKGLGLQCSADRAATCTVTATLQAKDARKLGLSKSRKKAYVIARVTVRLKKAGKATLKLKLSRKVSSRLKRTKRITVLVAGTAADTAGGKIALRRAVLLRR
jgi:subtilisin-like proprotein convertase family protein